MRNRSGITRTVFAFALLVIITFLCLQDIEAGGPVLSKGQTVYVPAYSHITLGVRRTTELKFELLINLSVRNTDPNKSLTITAVDYYNSEGKLIKKFIITPLTLGPMASTYFLIEQLDISGGWGANFLIQWRSEKKLNEPIIQGVTYGSKGKHSISFVSQGKVISEASDRE
ncbi:MAG: DUF3124 domain-containing protein [Deltaproteobacteria bacterium]|nr:DUF3124 domain-containing protein [Deltaproteobacteria bacterium]